MVHEIILPPPPLGAINPHLTVIFISESGVGGSLWDLFLKLFWNQLGISGTLLRDGCHFCHQTNDVKALKETQNTDSNPVSGLMASSFLHPLPNSWWKALLSLCWVSIWQYQLSMADTKIISWEGNWPVWYISSNHGVTTDNEQPQAKYYKLWQKVCGPIVIRNKQNSTKMNTVAEWC